MAIVYFNQATALALKAAVGHTAAATPLTVRLFNNDHTPAVTDTEADYAEVSGGGYAAIALTGASWTVAVENPSSVSYPSVLFQFTGATSEPSTVYGYYVTDVNGKALFAERLSAPPFTPTVNGDEVVVGLNVTDGSVIVILANKFIVQGTADAQLAAAQFLGALATGIIKNTTTTGVLSIAAAGDFPTLNQNTSGTASNVSGTPALPDGTTATTQAASDNSTKLATTAYTDAVAVNPKVKLFRAYLRVTDAQIKALNSTPIQIIAAPGNNLLIVPIRMVTTIHVVAGGGYNSSQSVSIRYNGIATDIVAGYGGVNSTAANDRTSHAIPIVAFQATDNSHAENLAINVFGSGDRTGGNASNYMDVWVYYWVHDISQLS
jgi:hypothetical protein